MMLGGTVIRLTGTRGATAALSTVAAPSNFSITSVFKSNNIATKNGAPRFSTMPITSPSPSQVIAPGWHRQFNSTLRFQNEMKWNHIRSFSSKDSDEPMKDSVQGTVSGSSQHDTWVNFQRSIAVSGFETGQTVTEKILGRKHRGGKVNRKMKEREAELAAALSGADSTNLKGGEFPALRYSDEETERLLAQAYAAIPPRAGKRGTRNLKREKRRWFIKRSYDAKKKYERMAEHERRMAKRHEISVAMHQVRTDAPEVRDTDQEYRKLVFDRWVLTMGNGNDGSEEESSGQNEAMSP